MSLQVGLPHDDLEAETSVVGHRLLMDIMKLLGCQNYQLLAEDHGKAFPWNRLTLTPKRPRLVLGPKKASPPRRDSRNPQPYDTLCLAPRCPRTKAWNPKPLNLLEP